MYTAAQKSIAQQDELRFVIRGMRLEREGFVQLQIAVISGVGTGKALTLAPGNFVIGRDDAADLQIADEFVSLRHCIVSVGPDRYEIKDCGSLNGTRLNGERIVGSEASIRRAPSRVDDGDRRCWRIGAGTGDASGAHGKRKFRLKTGYGNAHRNRW
jgi:hypothetical protein